MDWTVSAPWGKIACVSWGNPRGAPVLLVHGYMDSAATFIPLVRLLPGHFHYVAFDMPGHGRSDAFPVGPAASHAHLVEAARRVVRHLGWTSFLYISHSVGFIVGVLYNAVFPGEIRRMVHIDAVQPLAQYCFHEYDQAVWFAFTYEEYYDNFPKWAVQRARSLKYEDAVGAVAANRKVSRELAELLLSRALTPVGGGLYRYTWEPTMKKVATLAVTEDYLHSLMKLSPPTLNVVAQDSSSREDNAKGVELMNKFVNTINDFHIIHVAGHHDVHVTHPDRFVKAVEDFFNEKHNNMEVLSKL